MLQLFILWRSTHATGTHDRNVVRPLLDNELVSVCSVICLFDVNMDSETQLGHTHIRVLCILWILDSHYLTIKLHISMSFYCYPRLSYIIICVLWFVRHWVISRNGQRQTLNMLSHMTFIRTCRDGDYLRLDAPGMESLKLPIYPQICEENVVTILYV